MAFSAVAVAAAVANTFFSVVLVLLNKRLITTHHFSFMTVLSGLHFATSFVVCLVMIALGTLKHKAVNSYWSIFRISLGSLLSVVFMNYCLSHSSIGFYQVAKLSCIPFTILFERMLGLQQEVMTLPLIASLLLIIGGMLLIIREEITTNFSGFIWGLCGVITTALSQVFFGPLKKGLNLDAMQLLFHTTPWLTFGSFIIVPVFENTDALMKYDFNFDVLIAVLLTCITAVAFNMSNYLVLAEISPLSYNIMGHVKTIVIIAVGSYVFNTIPSMAMLWGMTIAIAGVLYFTYEKDQQGKAKTALPVPDNRSLTMLATLEDGQEESEILLADVSNRK